jgi:hypothetical protein
MVDAVGATAYSYDGVGQVLSENGPWTDDAVSYTYTNRLRTRTSVMAPDAAAWTQSYTEKEWRMGQTIDWFDSTPSRTMLRLTPS